VGSRIESLEHRLQGLTGPMQPNLDGVAAAAQPGGGLIDVELLDTA